VGDRRYVFVTAKPPRVYGPRGEPRQLRWLPITPDVRDEQIWQAHPGEYAIHPDLDRVYILAQKDVQGR